jgi:uncharacterized membrane protein
MGSPKHFFNEEERKKILDAIREAESRTSGRIRVRVEKTCKDPMLDARKAFTALGMHRTEKRNSLLFFLSVEDRKFVILGDDGIHKKVPEGFWEKVRDAVEADFRKKRFAEGLADGIRMAGEQLALHFPHEKERQA